VVLKDYKTTERHTRRVRAFPSGRRRTGRSWGAEEEEEEEEEVMVVTDSEVVAAIT
jgi:hypothetical protein